MREAVGNSTILVIIVFFTVVVLGYLAFNVNYTKAFRMKNKIISVYEQYKGNCDASCKEEIYKFSREIAYTFAVGSGAECPSDSGAPFEPVVINGSPLYCIKTVETYDYPDNLPEDVKPTRYYVIVTAINVQLPIISRILAYDIFRISGSTRAFGY